MRFGNKRNVLSTIPELFYQTTNNNLTKTERLAKFFDIPGGG